MEEEEEEEEVLVLVLFVAFYEFLLVGGSTCVRERSAVVTTARCLFAAKRTWSVSLKFGRAARKCVEVEEGFRFRFFLARLEGCSMRDLWEAAEADCGSVFEENKLSHSVYSCCNDNGGCRACVDSCGAGYIFSRRPDAGSGGGHPDLSCNSGLQQHCDTDESAELRYNRIREDAHSGVQRILQKPTKTGVQRPRAHSG